MPRKLRPRGRSWTLGIVGGSMMVVGSLMRWRTTGMFTWPGQSGGAGFVLLAGVSVLVLALARQTKWPAVAVQLLAGIAAFYVAFRNLNEADPIGSGVALSHLGSVLVLGSVVDRGWQWMRSQAVPDGTHR